MSTNGFDRDALIAKYGIDRPPQADNSTVTAILAAQRTVARAVRFTGDTSWLFDHAYNRDMWELASKTIQDMHGRFGDFMTGVWGEAVFLYYPGTEDFHAYDSDIERYAYVLAYVGQNGCDIRLAPGGCSKGTVFLPLQRGPFIVVFEACDACDAWARETAETNFKFGVMAAQTDLPPGARIDPARRFRRDRRRPRAAPRRAEDAMRGVGRGIGMGRAQQLGYGTARPLTWHDTSPPAPLGFTANWPGPWHQAARSCVSVAIRGQQCDVAGVTKVWAENCCGVADLDPLNFDLPREVRLSST
jgi:hypothetical protein